VKFGIFYEMFVPPDEPDAEARIIRETVDQIVHADRNGFDYVWLTEHHFLKGFSHMSAPEVLFGAAAAQTEHIRFGFGLALTPPSYNHPVRIAERVALLDCLSGGRVDMGSGRSTTPAELYGFGIDPEQSRAQWQEGLEAVAQLLAHEDVALDGQFVKMPARTVVPRPVQKPHPPLWVGSTGPDNATRAARKGLGMLFFVQKTDFDTLSEATAAYHANIDKAEPICGAVNNQTAGFVNGLCSYDRNEVRELAAVKMVEHSAHGAEAMLTGWPGGQATPSYAHVTSGEVALLREAIKWDRKAIGEVMLNEGFVMAGTPEDCAKVLDSFKASGVDQVVIHMQMGGVPHDRIVESIELIGKELIPSYR
jgi:alkanesulfonate monooxygenase SsuD/methylene tetrahydromethanopterin reductase-like flavin-dependent oxidoreductase (luciferase family)